MTTEFTAIKNDFLESRQFTSLSFGARWVFYDLLRRAKAANPKARGHPKNDTPFRFHPRHTRPGICQAHFYAHVRTFEALGLIDIIRPRRPGLPNLIVLSEHYRHIVR